VHWLALDLWTLVPINAVALGRTRVGARARLHHWPPTAPARLAWLPTLPGWSVAMHEGSWRAVPVGPRPSLNARDAAVVAALYAGANTRAELLGSLTNIGYHPSTALVQPQPGSTVVGS